MDFLSVQGTAKAQKIRYRRWGVAVEHIQQMVQGCSHAAAEVHSGSDTNVTGGVLRCAREAQG